MKKLVLSILSLLFFISIGHAQAVNKLYFSDFEAPDYIPGPIAGQNGWAEFVADPGSAVIANSNPYNGSQSMMITADGSVAAGTFTGALSPLLGLGLYTSNYASMSAWVAIEPGMGGIIFEIAPQTPSEGFLITRLRFNEDLSIDILEDQGGGLAFFPTGASAPMEYFYLVVNINRTSGDIDLYMDGNLFYQSSTAGPSTDIEQVVILLNETASGGSAYVDDLCIADGLIPPDPFMEPIPTMSQWGLFILSLIFMIFGKVAITSRTFILSHT